MNKRLIMLMAAALALLSARGQIEFTDYGEYEPIKIHLSDTHGTLNDIYVVYDTQGVKMTFNSSTGVPATWETYDYHNGGLYFEQIPVRWDGIKTTLNQVISNKGYKIVEGTTPYYCWVVNYADYYLELNDMSYDNDDPCGFLTFTVDGHGDAIPYYNLDGTRLKLDREIKMTYYTLVWSDTDSVWSNPQEVVELFESLEDDIVVPQPLCNTGFLLTGDRFLEEWGIPAEAEVGFYETQAVDCKSTAEQYVRENDNEKEKRLDNSYGGSAPVRILFTGYPTDAVVYRIWEMATDQDFENVILQYYQDEVEYTFEDFGTYYMRYSVNNREGTCPVYGDVYTINVRESQLDCPNVFSPGSTEGVNDIWKVSYKSLVEFHCWIYNRWGNLVYEYTDPGGGWDGTYRGKLVDTGVYYYVVTALGSDGVKWKKRGDITILRYKRGAAGAETGEGGGY